MGLRPTYQLVELMDYGHGARCAAYINFKS
jgi:hypothetical protein